MKNYLLITLGHNSSAIFVNNTSEERYVIGYEQERLSRIKADSQFPIDAINEIEHNVGLAKMKGCVILVSHWFNIQQLRYNKYISSNDMDKLKSYNPEIIKFVTPEFTHHDAHAYSVHAFYKYYACGSHSPRHTIVADGFGNNEEVLSIYGSLDKNGKPELIHRVFGYEYSLGLFYQFATSFVGMKENQDEYKFLGYEAHIDENLSQEAIDCIDHFINDNVAFFVEAWTSEEMYSGTEYEGIINYESLTRTKDWWYSVFKEVLQSIGITDRNSYDARCAIAYFIQQTCEIALSQLIDIYGITNLSVAGGVFYNVKLNNFLLKKIRGTFCAMPLAGDQGAAIGMYEAEDKNDAPEFPFDTLAWGKRRLYNFSKIAGENKNINYWKIHKTDTEAFDTVAKKIAKHISNGHLVNVVFGNMEFGPRALGNTSTLFLPTVENVGRNNSMNNRNEVMPCAPVCTAKNAFELFDGEELNRVIGSDRFMICTHEFKRPFTKQYGGVMHRKTLDTVYTGRPQIVRCGSFIDNLLKYVEAWTDCKCLVNTSFNAHGNPIVFDTKDIIDNYNYQCLCTSHDVPMLFVIEVV